MRPTHATHADTSGAGLASRRCARLAAVAADRVPVRAPQRPPRWARWACGGGAATTLRPEPARQTGRGESWATRAQGPGGAAVAAAASSRTTAAHVAIHTHMHLFSRARRTSLEMPRRSKERSARVARASGMTPGACTVAPKPPPRSATRVECLGARVELQAQRAASGMGREGARIRALAAAAHLLRRCRGGPTTTPGRGDGRGAPPTQTPTLSAAPTGWERSSWTSAIKGKRQSHGRVHGWRMAKARIFSRSK